MSSIWGHWSGGLRGSWASRSPSLEADARAVLALMTGHRSVKRGRYHTARAAGEQRDNRWQEDGEGGSAGAGQSSSLLRPGVKLCACSPPRLSHRPDRHTCHSDNTSVSLSAPRILLDFVQSRTTLSLPTKKYRNAFTHFSYTWSPRKSSPALPQPL